MLVTIGGGVNRCIKIADEDHVIHDFCLFTLFNLSKSRIYLVEEKHGRVKVLLHLKESVLKTFYIAGWPRTQINLSLGLYFFKYHPACRMKSARSIG